MSDIRNYALEHRQREQRKIQHESYPFETTQKDVVMFPEERDLVDRLLARGDPLSDFAARHICYLHATLTSASEGNSFATVPSATKVNQLATLRDRIVTQLRVEYNTSERVAQELENMTVSRLIDMMTYIFEDE